MEDFKNYRLFSELRSLYASTEDYRRTLRISFRLTDKINVPSLSYAIKNGSKKISLSLCRIKKGR